MTTDYPQSAIVAADGTASITWAPRVSSVAWLVSQVSVSLSTGSGNAFLFRNGYFLTGTVAGGSDSADGSPPTVITADDNLTLSWTGAVPGAIAKGTIFYEERPR